MAFGIFYSNRVRFIDTIILLYEPLAGSHEEMFWAYFHPPKNQFMKMKHFGQLSVLSLKRLFTVMWIKCILNSIK